MVNVLIVRSLSLKRRFDKNVNNYSRLVFFVFALVFESLPSSSFQKQFEW